MQFWLQAPDAYQEGLYTACRHLLSESTYPAHQGSRQFFTFIFKDSGEPSPKAGPPSAQLEEQFPADSPGFPVAAAEACAATDADAAGLASSWGADSARDKWMPLDSPQRLHSPREERRRQLLGRKDGISKLSGGSGASNNDAGTSSSSSRQPSQWLRPQVSELLPDAQQQEDKSPSVAPESGIPCVLQGHEEPTGASNNLGGPRRWIGTPAGVDDEGAIGKYGRMGDRLHWEHPPRQHGAAAKSAAANSGKRLSTDWSLGSCDEAEQSRDSRRTYVEHRSRSLSDELDVMPHAPPSFNPARVTAHIRHHPGRPAFKGRTGRFLQRDRLGSRPSFVGSHRRLEPSATAADPGAVNGQLLLLLTAKAGYILFSLQTCKGSACWLADMLLVYLDWNLMKVSLLQVKLSNCKVSRT